MTQHGDGGKGSDRRKENTQKVRDNWDKINWGKKDVAEKQQKEEPKKL